MEGMKHCGWGIVDKDGNSAGFLKDTYETIVDGWNGLESPDEKRPYRVVELFYKDEQS